VFWPEGGRSPTGGQNNRWRDRQTPPVFDIPASCAAAPVTHQSEAATISVVLQKRLAPAGMNPDFFSDGRADFRLDAFNEAHAHPLKFIGRSDGGGKLQCGLFHFTPAKVRSGVDVLDRVLYFVCSHNFGFIADSFNDTTILSGALFPDSEFDD
jgi:hypothetical protein